MLIFRDRRIILVTPPKNGSTSLHEALSKQSHVIWMNGPVGRTWTQSQHTTQIPSNYADYSIYLVVRNPWDRMMSLWKHYTRYNYPRLGVTSFEQFIHTVNTSDHWFLRNQKWYEENIEVTHPEHDGLIRAPLTGVLPIEAISKILGLGPIPRLHILTCNGTEYTSETVKKVVNEYPSIYQVPIPLGT